LLLDSANYEGSRWQGKEKGTPDEGSPLAAILELGGRKEEEATTSWGGVFVEGDIRPYSFATYLRGISRHCKNHLVLTEESKVEANLGSEVWMKNSVPKRRD